MEEEDRRKFIDSLTRAATDPSDILEEDNGIEELRKAFND